MDLGKIRTKVSDWFENAKTGATVAPSKGQLLAWLLLVSFINILLYEASESTSSCDFDRTDRHLSEVEIKIDLLEYKINNIAYFLQNPEAAQSDEFLAKNAKEVDTEVQKSIRKLKLISSEIDKVCDSAKWYVYWMYVIATLAALFLAWATINADNKPVTKRKPKPKTKPSPLP